MVSLGIRTLEAIAADAWLRSGTVVRELVSRSKIVQHLKLDVNYAQRI